MSLTCRCRNHNISILDGYFVEELAHYFRSCCVHILCAFTELITLKDLVQTEILSYAENVFERFLSPFIPQSIKRQFKCLQNRELRAPVTDTLDSVTVRYTFSSRLPQTELRDTEFGEAFLSPLHRLANRWYNRMMGDEIFLQNFLTAYRLARTKYFDLYFENAIIHGNVEQVLILGAGFDTRAFRYEALRAKYNSTRHDNRKTFDDDMEEKTEELQPIENEPHHQDCPKFTCPKSCSTHNSRSHINVIELDALDIQKRKSKILSDYFPHSEALKFSQGVVFVGCDFSQSFCLTTALNNHFFDPKRNTLILAEDLISKLSLEVVEGMFRSLRELWMKSSSAENDRLTSNSSTQDGEDAAEWRILFDYFSDEFVRGHSTVKNRALLRRLKDIRTGLPKDKDGLRHILSSYGIQIEQILNEEKLMEMSQAGVKNWDRCEHLNVVEGKFVI